MTTRNSGKDKHVNEAAKGLRRRPGKPGWQFQMKWRGRDRVIGLGTKDLIEAQKMAQLIRANPARHFDRERDATADWDELASAYLRERIAAREIREGKSVENVSREIASFRAFARRGSPVHVNNADLQRWYDWLRDPRREGHIKNYSAHTYVARVRPFLHWLAERGRTSYDPQTAPKLIPLRKHEVSRVVVAEAHHVKRIIESCTRLDLKLVFYLGFQAGFRREEICMARPEWFDLGGETISVPDYQDVNGRTWEPKDAERRNLPILPQLLNFLTGEFKLASHRDAPYLLHPEANGVRYRWDFIKPFTQHVKACGLAWITPHVMRHTFATACLQANYTLPKVAEWMGDHTSTVEKQYSHLVPRKGEITRDPFA